MFQYTINTESEEPIMLINKHIGFDEKEGVGIDGSLFQQELLALDQMGKKRIQVWINSPGGIVMDGYNIYNAILKSDTKVDTYCTGIAASIAAVIFQAGRNRTMSDYGLLMYHNPYGGNDGEELKKMKGSLVKMIAAKCGKGESEISAMMDKTTWITASDALSTGMCDTIEVSSQQNVKHGNAKAMWEENNKILNSILNLNVMSENKLGTSLIANYLGLNTEATESSVLNELKNKINSEILNRTKAEDSKAELQKEIDAMKKKMADLQNSYDEKCKAMTEMEDSAKAELAKAQNKAKEIEQAANLEKATNMVTDFAKAGKIKNDQETISKWANKAVLDFDGVKELIETLPINKVANKLDDNTNNNLPEGANGHSAIAVMARIQAKIANKK